MMEFAIAKIRAIGQIVISSSLGGDILNGDKFLIVRDDGKIILKNIKK